MVMIMISTKTTKAVIACFSRGAKPAGIYLNLQRKS